MSRPLGPPGGGTWVWRPAAGGELLGTVEVGVRGYAHDRAQLGMADGVLELSSGASRASAVARPPFRAQWGR